MRRLLATSVAAIAALPLGDTAEAKLERNPCPQPPSPAKQICAGWWVGLNAKRHRLPDPWPNCPDPVFGGGGWYDTVRCENSGHWYDTPGFFRCGLQFHPMWERYFGRLC